MSDDLRAFTDALREWVGERLNLLAMSFYGAQDGMTARVARDGYPLFGLLHYIIRANGCSRVLETGTARGVSAACIASAVCHREGARVVTFDISANPERSRLWALLPAPARSCIEPRVVDSLAGMAAAIAAGETYHAALLDSDHTEEHVWAEFQLAAQLVCQGGLILIHDATLPGGTVAAALDRIRGAGYGVVTLWTAEDGTPEDDGLGLAVIENRVRV